MNRFNILARIYFYESVFWIKFARIYFCKWLFDKLFAKINYCGRQKEELRKNEECCQALEYVTGYAVVSYYLVLCSIDMSCFENPTTCNIDNKKN